MRNKTLIASIVVSVVMAVSGSAATDQYEFVVEESTVVQTGGFAGVHITYSVKGRFQLTVDHSARTASFDWVRATLSGGPFLPEPDLGKLFNMTKLVGTVVSNTEIEFKGHTATDPKARVAITVNLKSGVALLKGEIKSPCCDLYDYALEAVAKKLPDVPPIVMKYCVASPRACLIGPAPWDAASAYMPRADADNFPRRHGSLRVRTGTKVIFCLSRDLEGIWYTGSCGALGTSIVMQLCRACKCPDPEGTNCECVRPDPNNPYARCKCEKCLEVGAVCCPSPDDPAIVPCPWITIGRDGAKCFRKGPSIGRARIGVPVHFRRPGIYLLRAIVHTFAQPGYPWPHDGLSVPDDTGAMPEIAPTEDKDVVYIRVRVLDCPTDDVDPDEIPTDDPDFMHIKPMPKDIDEGDPVEFDGDLNGDEVIDMADFSIMSQQWGREYEPPFADDE